jgi:hypothetical protein
MPNPADYPNTNKGYKRYMKDCMHITVHTEHKKPDQGIAQCLNMWRKKHGPRHPGQPKKAEDGFQFPHENYLRDHFNCPVCGEKYSGQCRCRLGNKYCANKHGWHTCPVHDKVFVGDSHNLGAMRAWSKCTCPLSEEEKGFLRQQMASRIASTFMGSLPTDIKKIDKSKKPSIFLGGECDEGNKWRDEIKYEFEECFLFLDPYDPNWEPEDNIYDEITGLIKADYVVFFKGGEGTDKEKKLLDQNGKKYESFDDIDDLYAYLVELARDVYFDRGESGHSFCWNGNVIKNSDYPDHPDDIVVSKSEHALGGPEVTELDVFSYYTDGVLTKMLQELTGRNLFIAVKPREKTPKGKPIYVRHPYNKKTDYIRISNAKDFETYHSGRTIEYHVTMPALCPYYIIDFDAVEDWATTKKITAECSTMLGKLPEVKKVEIRYSGKRGFHILGWLKKSMPIDKARESLKEHLKETFGDRKDLVLGESPSGKKGALGVSPMKLNGGQVALWSMRVTGLCCVEVPQTKLAGFKKEDARPEKVYKKLTGKTLVPAKKKEAAQRVVSAFLKIAGYDREKIKPGYKGKFVIHNHLADKAGQHWDLRLEFPVTSVHKALKDYEGKRLPGRREPEGPYPDKPGTVFRSFAVRKHRLPAGSTKMFIVETEDHPIAYGTFRGKIPEGYGAGDVEIFDHGTYEILDVEGDKKYTLEFHGKKVHGAYALVKYQRGFLWVKAKEKKASAIDYIRPTMHPGIWDLQKDPPLMIEKVRKDILNVLSKSVEKDLIKSVFISGSAASYNYKEDGDLDIDVLVNFNDQEKQVKLQTTVDKNREKKAPGTDLTYSFFLLSPGDFPKSDGIYDLMENKWIHGPIKIPEDFDPDNTFTKEKEIAVKVLDRIYGLIAEVKIALKDLKRIDQYMKAFDKLQPQRLVVLSRLKGLCFSLANLRAKIWGLHEASLKEEPIYPAFNFSRDWDARYILFKYIARYGGHEPVQLLYSMIDDDDIKVIKPFMPENAVGRFFKTASADIRDVYEDTIEQFESGKKKQPWELVKRNQALRVWKKFGGTGEITKEDIFEIYELTKENLVKVIVNSMLWDSDHINDKNSDEFYKFIKDEKNFGRRTDQDRRFNNALTVMEKAHTPLDQLLAVDRVFDLIHGSGPVANWFIEGGTATLSELQDWVPKSLVEKYHHKA